MVRRGRGLERDRVVGVDDSMGWDEMWGMGNIHMDIRYVA